MTYATSSYVFGNKKFLKKYVLKNFLTLLNYKNFGLIFEFNRCERSSFNCTAKFTAKPAGNECKECSATGYTYEEHSVFMGDTIKSVKDKTWAECVVECDRYSTCTAFAYQKDLKLCYLKKSSDGEAIFKQNYIYSRFCGRRPETESAVTNEFNCPTRECRSCSTTGYTNELGYYSGAAIKTVTKNKEGNKVTRDECAKECDMELDCVATRYNRNDSKFYWLTDTQLCGVFTPLEFSRSKFLIQS